MSFDYKTIKAASLNELRIKIARCQRKGWTVEGNTEIQRVKLDGRQISMLSQNMIRYKFESVYAL
jgi:hypothetical protein